MIQLHGPSILADRLKFWCMSIFNSTFICSEETSIYWSVQVCSVFLCFSLVTINRQTSYDSGILHTGFADWSYEVCRLGHYLGSTKNRKGQKWAGLITEPDQTVRAVHSCNSFFQWTLKYLLGGTVLKSCHNVFSREKRTIRKIIHRCSHYPFLSWALWKSRLQWSILRQLGKYMYIIPKGQLFVFFSSSCPWR